MSTVQRFEMREALALSRDARVTAIRWDLVPWGLTLDLDGPVTEEDQAPMRRIWLVFSGVSEITIPFQETRLPTGIWLTSDFVVNDSVNGFRRYTCAALFPEFRMNQLQSDRGSGQVEICAQDLVGLASTGAASPAEYGLSRIARNQLCSDDEMLAALGEL